MCYVVVLLDRQKSTEIDRNQQELSYISKNLIMQFDHLNICVYLMIKIHAHYNNYNKCCVIFDQVVC